MERFDTSSFLLFFSLIVILYYNLSGKWQWRYLLLGSILFYSWNNLATIAAPLVIIAVTYLAGNYIERVGLVEKKRQTIFVLAVLLNIGLLVFFKYISFFVVNISALLGLVKPGFTNATVDQHWFHAFVIPLGISYLTFQSIGYLIEIRRGSIQAEKKIVNLAGYLLFFPKIIAGPVERAQHFLPQIGSTITFDYDKVSVGIRQVGWGLFKKLVVADRLGLFVNSVYDDVHHNAGYSLLIAACIFPIQIYADFSGYTDMALGLARILGYDLQRNFNQPFSARSIVEFWRRWHMSLSTWFNDYFYTPLVIKMRDLGKWSVVLASMITFLVLGLWHGPNLTYVVFGGIQGFFIAIELFTTKQRKRIRNATPAQINKVIGIVYVFAVFAFASIYFRSGTVSDAKYFIKNIFSGTLDIGSLKTALQNHVLGMYDYMILMLAIPFMFLAEAKGLSDRIVYSPKWIRWSVYYLFLTVIIVYGVTGSGFIYKQF
jgi:alginate O-acetyltransferase complex protein AlgI